MPTTFAAPPSSKGQFGRIDLHAGLVCLNGPPGMDLQMQRDLFAAILDELDADADLVNKGLEATLETADSEEIVIQRYPLPQT